MAVARFQVVSLPRTTAEVPSVKFDDDGVVVRVEPTRRRRFTWRFLAANNRSLAMASTVYPDVSSCLAALYDLKRGLDTAQCEYLRDDKGMWRWVVRVGDSTAASSNGYPRQVRARLTCESFFHLAADPQALQNVQFVYR